MFVKQLIGRMAGAVVEMPFAAATSNIAAGTCVLATEDEVAAAGLHAVPTVTATEPEVLPAGYRTEVAEVEGFDLFDAGGVRLNQEPFANLPALLSFAHERATAMAPVALVIPLGQIPGDEPPMISFDGYRFEPAEGGGFLLFDPAGAPLGVDPVADEEAARLGLRQHYAAARGMTLEELEAEEAAASNQIVTVAVPENWRSLHHTQRRALAQQISGEAQASTAAADEVIEEYVTRPAA